MTSTTVQQHNNNNNNSQEAENLSFCGCGFLGIYHVGVATCFHEYAPQLSLHKISGASAGAIVATAYLCGNLQLALATTDILKVAIDARARGLGLPVGSFHPEFDINQLLLEALEKGLPDDVHIRASGKLHISLTRYRDFENIIISEFPSKEDLIRVLMCSCFIPFWSGSDPPKYKGVTYVDGGLSNNLLILDERTVTVSPFSGEADICPIDQMMNLVQVRLSNTSFLFTPTNLFRLLQVFLPPSPQKLSNLFQQGFDDAMRFLQNSKLISCNKCLSALKPILKIVSTDDISGSVDELDEKLDDKLDERMVLSVDSSSICEQSYEKLTTLSPPPPPPPPPLPLPPSPSLSPSPTKTTNDDSKTTTTTMANDCNECLYRRENAWNEPLPKQFADRIREACEQVNKTFHNWIHTHKLGYLGYIPIVYYLPIDITLALFLKYWKKFPSAKDLAQSLLSTVSSWRKKSSLPSVFSDKSGGFKLERYLEILLLYTEILGQQKI